jgi:hypothetical protein
MRASLWMLPLVVVVVAACNEPFSNEDILFLKAVPSSSQVEIRVPSGLSTCSTAPNAEYQPFGRDVADGINQAISNILNNIVGTAVRTPPTRRENDLRQWGPWSEDGIDYQFLMARTSTAVTLKTTETSTPTFVEQIYQYTLQAKRSGDPTFVNAISGAFAPSESLDSGMGYIYLNFEEIHQKVDPNSKDRGLLLIAYDNRDQQSSIQVVIDSEVDLGSPFEKAEGYYIYSERADGFIRFDFVVEFNVPDVQPDTQPEYLFIRQRYVADERGRADVGLGGGDLGALVFYANECWDECLQRTYLGTNIPNKQPYGSLDACAPELQVEPDR